MTARFFLVAPKDLDVHLVIACATAATAVGDCASIIVYESIKQEEVAKLQDLGLAVLMGGGFKGGSLAPHEVAGGVVGMVVVAGVVAGASWILVTLSQVTRPPLMDRKVEPFDCSTPVTTPTT